MIFLSRKALEKDEIWKALTRSFDFRNKMQNCQFSFWPNGGAIFISLSLSMMILKAAEMNIFKVAGLGKGESWSQKIIDWTGD